MTLLSVCMAVRNGQATIEHAVRSIRRQTFADWELVLIDDGSIDETVNIVRAFADARIRLFQNPQSLGLAASLNMALSQSKGKFIARMDADDVCFPRRFDQQLRYLEQYPKVDLVGGQALMFCSDWDLAGVLNVPLDHEQITRTPGSSFPLLHPSWMGKADWFTRYKYDEQYIRAQDFEMLLRAMPHSVYANIPDVVLGYRYEKQSLAKRRASRAYQRLAISKNRASLKANHAWAMSALWMKDLADMILSSGGIELSRTRTAPSPVLIQQWFDLVGSLE